MHHLLAYIHRDAVAVLLKEMSASLTGIHMECLLRSEEITNQIPFSGEITQSVSNPCPFNEEWKFPWREVQGDNVMALFKYRMTVKKRTMEFSSSSQVHRTRINVWKSQEIDLETKPGLIALYCMYSVQMLIERKRWVPSHSVHFNLHKDAPSPAPTIWTAEKGLPDNSASGGYLQPLYSPQLHCF